MEVLKQPGQKWQANLVIFYSIDKLVELGVFALHLMSPRNVSSSRSELNNLRTSINEKRAHTMRRA